MTNMANEFIKRERKVIAPDIDLHGRIQPQAIDYEEATLGAMMLEQNATGLVIDKLSTDMFYKEAHKHIFEAIHQVFESGNPVDLLSITTQLRKSRKLEVIGGSYYLATLTNKVVSSANIEFYARIISEKYIQRQLISVSTQTIKDAFDESTDVLQLLDNAEKNLFEIAEKSFHRTNLNMTKLIQDFVDEMKEARNSKELRGLPSGFTDLDRTTGGWQKSNLIILAARPGMGKTAFVLSMARNMAVEQRKSVAFFSLEMSAADLVMRLVSAETGIRNENLRKADLTNHEWGEMVEKLTALTDAPFFIDDSPGLSIFELRAKCRRLKQQHDIECVIIDYLQLMSGGKETKGGNREQEISTISRSLKALSKELNIPVIALSQLNRSVESRATQSKRPQLSDLRESGAIEQDADMVMFIYRPEYYKLDQFEDGSASAGLADLIIAKNRNGGQRDIRLRFIKEQVKFCDKESDFSPMTNLAEATTTSITIQSAINNIQTSGPPMEMPF
jgi:replicative DNA helicase